MTAAGRQELLGLELAREQVEIPGLERPVFVVGLTLRERDRFEIAILRNRHSTADVRAWLLICSLVNEAGARIFSDEDLELVAGLPAAALQKAFEASSRLSGLGKDDVEDLSKNSGSGPEGGSSSGSPSGSG